MDGLEKLEVLMRTDLAATQQEHAANAELLAHMILLIKAATTAQTEALKWCRVGNVKQAEETLEAALKELTNG